MDVKIDGIMIKRTDGGIADEKDVLFFVSIHEAHVKKLVFG